MAEMHQRVKTALEFALESPVLQLGEHGLESDTGLFKIGDGKTRWNSLDYYGQSTGGSSSLLIADGVAVDLPNQEPEGYLVGYRVKSTTTIEGFSFTPGTYIFERDPEVPSGWSYRVVADPAPIVQLGDTINPIESLVVLASDSSTATVTWDPSPLPAPVYEWRVWEQGTVLDDRGSWFTSGYPEVTIEGLNSSTSYVVEVRVFYSGARSSAAFEEFSTTAGWTLWAADDFDGATGVPVNGRSIPEGSSGLSWSASGNEWKLNGSGRSEYTASSWGQLCKVALPTLTRDMVRVSAYDVSATGAFTFECSYYEDVETSGVGTGGTIRQLQLSLNKDGSAYKAPFGASPGVLHQLSTPSFPDVLGSYAVEFRTNSAHMFVNGVEFAYVDGFTAAPCAPGAPYASFDGNLVSSVGRVTVELL